MKFTNELVVGGIYRALKSGATGAGINEETTYIAIDGGKVVQLDGQQAGAVIKPHAHTVWERVK